MSDLWRNNGGIYVGGAVANEPPEPPPPSDVPPNLLAGEWEPSGDVIGYSGDRHISVFGGMGAGKSRRLLMVNLLRLVDWSAVVVDVKGELAAYTAAHRARSGSVLVIDPFGVLPANYPALIQRHPWLGRSHGLNPLAGLDPSAVRFVDDAKTLAEALIRLDEKEKHWGQSAQGLVKGVVMAARAKYGEAASLGMLRNILGRDPKTLAAWIKDRIGELSPAIPAIGAALNRYAKYQPDNREIFSILSNALTQTDWLDSPPMQADLQAGRYDFRQLKAGAPHETGERRPVTVYLILPPDYLESHATWLRVLLSSMLLPLMRSAEQSAAAFPVLFALDEYAALGHMEIIERNMALMRGYGIKLLMILQDLQQLQDVHEKRWESFIANSGVRLLFGPQDATTQEYFSKLSGQTVWTYATRSENTGENRDVTNLRSMFMPSTSSGITTAEAKTLVPRYAPEHLGAMRRGQALLFIGDTRSGAANIRLPSILPDPQSDEAAALLPDVHKAMTTAQQSLNATI